MHRMTHPPRQVTGGTHSDAKIHVTGGVDSHSEVHVAAAVCTLSHRLLGVARFATTSAGYVQLLVWLRSFGLLDAVGIEGTGSYAAGLTRYLAGEDVVVFEVDRPDRKARRQHGKSDPVDAEAAARAVLSGRATGTPKSREGIIEAIRVLQVVYRSAVKDRTAANNQFSAAVISAPAQIREEVEQIPDRQRIARVHRWRERSGDNLTDQATRQALRELAWRSNLLSEQAARVEAELDVLTEQAAPALRDLAGVGVHTAAQLLITFGGNTERITSEAAFAHLCGAAPIPASSGKTTRHRLNRGGDRAANSALWRIVMARRLYDPRTRAYVQRRRAEGLSDREITRCLKRYVARDIYRALTRPAPLAPRGKQLRQLRLAAGLPQRVVAKQFDIPVKRLSRIETGITRDPETQTRIHAWLTQHHTTQHAA